ncbi:hypothetical protein Lepil_2120 [Leptonema illini DSM 21528]|uniref:Uncharacterized protein n=1 Tax=Leptonema illini DSM 21528 TaxID=929563 RepID=H2CFU9_9LEPT|nr:hypothetical protein Lepil_2120 [Leptonema illini DSM 21528]
MRENDPESFRFLSLSSPLPLIPLIPRLLTFPQQCKKNHQREHSMRIIEICVVIVSSLFFFRVFVDKKLLLFCLSSPVSPWLFFLLFLSNTGKPYDPEPRRRGENPGFAFAPFAYFANPKTLSSSLPSANSEASAVKPLRCDNAARNTRRIYHRGHREHGEEAIRV